MKDFILRTQMMNGNRVHYKPGWDCHGLPIELKAKQIEAGMSDLEIRDKGTSPLSNYSDQEMFSKLFFFFVSRLKARKFATETVEQQKSQFESWGVTGDWNAADHMYRTIDKAYVENQLNLFHKLYAKELIVRDFKPVYWSTSSK